ncbi:uncharacterized protein LOC111638361 isoform X1 [Centruroides sculpturatus]|uniref:uncharacterized protein LOC111638361 isoform X1 n=1 Tax=Centruroides sculpturatus TaxID=218467 RepID=UPI000C6D3993|nr:uncharacterized protein LOC111638361 isoform X1 [Centruroides sculpturatus]
MNKNENIIISNKKDDYILKTPFIFIVAKRISAEINYLQKEFKVALYDIKTVANILGRSYPKFYRNVTEKLAKKVLMLSKESEVLEECRCLAIAVKIYFEKKQYSLAYDIAKYQNLLMNKIEKTYVEFIDSLILLLKAQYFKNWKAVEMHIKMAESAIEYCNNYIKTTSNISLEDMKFTGDMFYNVMYLELIDGNVDRCIHLGLEGIRLFSNTLNIKVLLVIMPIFIQALFYARLYSKCVVMLNMYYGYIFSTDLSSAIALYYGNTLQLLNHNVITATSEQLKMLQELSEAPYNLRPQSPDDIEFYLSANMTLWCIKNYFSEETEKWLSITMAFKEKKLTSYWASLAESCIININIDKFFTENIIKPNELKKKKRKIYKEIIILGKKVSKSYIVLLNEMNYLKNYLDYTWEHKMISI